MQIVTLSALLLAAPLLSAGAAAQGLSQYDAAGDPLVDPPPTAAAPGDVLNSFVHAFPNTDGLAPYTNGHLLMSLNDGQAFVYEVDTSGNTLNSFPVADDGDTWLAYDESRDLIITTNPVTDRVRSYTPGNATPVFDIAATVAGPVGATWDPVRDEYAICDWTTDVIVVFDATTLNVVRTMGTTLTRMAGMGFDCISGMYVVGERDSGTHAVVDPLTAQVLFSYPTATSGASSPRGHAVSTQGGMWAGGWNSALVVEQETDHAPIPGACDNSTPFMLRCDPAGIHSGGTSATLVASSVSGPGVLHLEASDGPTGQFGYFLVSLGLQEPGLPVAGGFLCLTFPLARYAPALTPNFNSLGQFDAAGVMQNIVGTSTVGSGYDVFANLPGPLNTTIQPGTSYYFQCWFRDGLSSNFSNVLQYQ